MLHTRFTEMFGLTYPLMSAPMASASGGTLAAAVSAGGGLGSFGAMHRNKDDAWVRDEIAHIRARTDRPFGVGFITPFISFGASRFDVALHERPPVIVLSFADPAPWVDAARAAGARVICQVQNYADAALAVAAGTDVLIAQGTEAGGHTGTMSLLPFLAGVVDRYPDIPVLAAGGIADGRTLAAVLAAGADGALLGTAFLATPEAIEVRDTSKALIVESDGADTVFTHAYDIVSGLPWPDGVGERVRRNRFTEEWDGRDAELRARREEIAAISATADPDPDRSAVLFGQSAGSVDAIRPAAEVLQSISTDAERILRSRPPALLS